MGRQSGLRDQLFFEHCLEDRVRPSHTRRPSIDPYDSFKPAPIGELAKWTYSESETRPLRRRLWEARPDRGAGMPAAAPGEGQEPCGTLPPTTTTLPADPEIASTVAPGQLLERAA
jgi:hypothetical protein